jgi:hypothetical protein
MTILGLCFESVKSVVSPEVGTIYLGLGAWSEVVVVVVVGLLFLAATYRFRAWV